MEPDNKGKIKEDKEDKEREDQNKYINIAEADGEAQIGQEIDNEEKNSLTKTLQPINLEYLKSMKEWNELGIPEWLAESLQRNHFKRPSKIQLAAFTMIDSHKNKPLKLVAQSQNGSGKTLAFLLNAILAVDEKLPLQNEKGLITPQVVILIHTLELAKQIKDIAEKILKETKIKCIIPSKSKDKVKAGQIIVTTPSFLSTNIKLPHKRISLEFAKVFILDEADAIIKDEASKGYIRNFVTQINKRNDLHFWLFSATFPEKMKGFFDDINLYKSEVINKISVPRNKLTLEGVHQMVGRVDKDEKRDYIKRVLEQSRGGQAIIFVNDKRFCAILMKFLRESFDVACIFGSPMRVEEREQIMNKFQENKIKILITTNLLARGIDLRRVKLVINADLPIKFENDSVRPDPETYLHRIGRTGRFGDLGIALNLIDDERSANNFKSIRNYYKIEEKDVKELENVEDLKPLLEELQNLNDKKRMENDEDTFE